MFIIKYKKIFISISVGLVLLSILLVSIFGLKFGIDFKGGALVEVNYLESMPSVIEVKTSLESLSLGEISVQPSGSNEYILKTRDLTTEEHTSLLNLLSENGKYKLTEKSFTSIGPSVGNELKRKAIWAIIFVMLAILLFIAYAFSKVSKPVSSWKYGLIALVTLLHDIAIPTGLFAILGHYMGAEVDTLFVVALLTVLGLSVSDTIVVFDRIRENIRNHTSTDFEKTVGISLGQTFTRSINTSLTVILVLLSLYFFGPDSTKNFALVLTVGLFFGTYSSIFLASPLLVVVEQWQTKNNKKSKK